ncbi:hypothetical protein IEN85_20535 [Pelagicoccus sp. NFK12]|uniref:Uncharacterized protein n=1 Tax=Pelagicoccus enzymogenes TaxID=2773457 RepID=A0A927FCL8_9BACT|nr:hypothetical protein [Pelagicoccus enzymogenes]MBD5781900.1 hypothetical protein [Pelagicoccus enzymogenes]
MADSQAFGGVDAAAGMQWNDGMATARADAESASLEQAFDGLGVERVAPAESETLGTGVDSLDEALEGGLRSGLLTELAESGASSGGQVLLLHLLAAMRRAQRFVALVDGADGFDPQSSPPELLEHLLWARCRSAGETMKVADALLRDENLGMVLVDLRGCGERELRRVKAADWYRLQRLAERSGAFVCVFTPQAMIPSAQVRVRLDGRLCIGNMDMSVRELGCELEFEVLRKRTRERGGFAQLVRRAVG